MKTVTGAESALEDLFDFFAERLEKIFPLQVEADLFLLNVVEAVNNAVEHGHTGNDQQRLQVCYSLMPNQAFVIVKDSGCGFIPHIPKFEDMTGARGRGLSMIKNNSDVMLLNRCGNEIAFFKGGFVIDCLLDRNEVVTMKNGVIIITDLYPNSVADIGHFFPSIFRSLTMVVNRKIFLDLRYFQILSSREWGLILAEAHSRDVALVVLFNAAQDMVETANTLCIQDQWPHGRKLQVFTELEPTIHLMAHLLGPVSKTENVERQSYDR